MILSSRFDASLAGSTWVGTVEAEFENAAVAVPAEKGYRLTLLRPGRDMVPFGAEVSFYRPPRVGDYIEVTFDGAPVDLTVPGDPGPVLDCPMYLLDSVGLGPGLTPAGDDRVVGALAAATRFVAPWLDEFRRAVADLPRDCTTPVSREMLDHAVAGRFPEALRDYVAALGDLWMPPRELRVRQNRLITRIGATSGREMLKGVEAVVGSLP